ncbi:MAG: serine protein kinase [Planctomycetota bacterium]|jgi:serine protein kinase|nr:serine protein kinase [Planctomycetota bacterium]
MNPSPLTSLLQKHLDIGQFEELNWQGCYEDYLDLIHQDPQILRNAFQRLFDMVDSYGTEEITRFKETIQRYKFFDDQFTDGRDAIFGLEKPLMKFMNILKAAAHGYGTERRVLLLHGPVGSSKSTIVRLLKKGLEHYSRTEEGKLYTYDWDAESTNSTPGTWTPCPMHEEPLRLIPESARKDVLKKINADSEGPYPLDVSGELCPYCRKTYDILLKQHQGNWCEVLKHVRIRRLVLSEKDRIGIGTFQPKDEKNQDSTELTGDINFRKIAEFGSDSDPRAFNFDGEFNIANRGIIEFIEVLKLDVAFLYDLLGASQEHTIKPKKFSQTDIDEVILAHTNEPEYRKLQNNELMEAFRDRTVKVDIPYNTRLQDEIQIYDKDYNQKRVPGKHLAPHTLETCAMWAILTRLEDPKKANLSLVQKLKLYNGKTLAGYTEDNVKELMDEAEREGMEGISPRYIQDKISNALVSEYGEGCVNPFMVLNEIEDGLEHHSLINSESVRKKYKDLLAQVRIEYEDTVKTEVQKSICADEDALNQLCGNYIDNVKAYTQREKVRNKYTGENEAPDERLMRSIEMKIDISETRKDDFRREIMNYIGALSLEGRRFDYRTNERLEKALELKLFEDKKDSIKLTSLVTSVVDRETQEKIDVVKSRLVKSYGYCETCSTDVLNFVASIFARGDAKE